MYRYGATTLVPNQWYYVTGVYNASAQTLDVYLNGQLDDGPLVGSVTTSQQIGPGDVTIGRRSGVSGFQFIGTIDEVRIYSQAISPAQIASDMATSVGASAPAAAPAAAYGFSEGSGSTTADSSGNGNTGSLSNASWTSSGKFGSAVQFNGFSSFVDIGNRSALQFTNSLTVSAWIYAAAFPADDAAVVSKRSNSSIGFQLDATVDTGPRTIGFKLTNASGGQMFRYGATTLSPNQWYYVTGVYNAAAQTIDVYLNGQLNNGQLVGSITNGQQNSTLDVTIGRRAGTTGFEFNGVIDEVRLYNQAISPAQIVSDMNTPVH
jgi:hypothetical protein